jgi:hypothetical protein
MLSCLSHGTAQVARRAHVTVLNYSCLEEKDKHRIKWVNACVRDLEQDVLVCDTLLHLKEIIMQYHGHKADFQARDQFGNDRVAALCDLDSKLNLQTKMVSKFTPSSRTHT